MLGQSGTSARTIVILSLMFSLPSTDHTLLALKKGHRYQQPMPAGSGDAWLLAHLAQQSQSPLVILCANPVDAHRLTDEIQLFARSEEHTSELQSRGHLVCRLLLEKKKKASRKIM